MGWVWEDEGPYTEDQIEAACVKDDRLYWELVNSIVAIISEKIDDYAENIAVINNTEEVDVDRAVESLCEALFYNLEDKLKEAVC